MIHAPSTRRRRAGGFTLIELMVAVIVSAIVVLGVFAFANIQRTNASMHERNVRVQQALEGAMWSLGQDLRQAGLGFTRSCTELRVWDSANGQLINPGAASNAADSVADIVTGERYWVLRDGIQAHWNSSGATSPDGGAGSSAAAGSAADSFDVILGEANYLSATGVFRLAESIDAGDATLVVETSVLLDSGNVAHLAQVQQLFPPGTFVVLTRQPGAGVNPFLATLQSQCVLLQVTDDVIAGASAQLWEIPIGSTSGFNADLAGVMAENADVASLACAGETPACVDDWDPAAFNLSATVVPVGRLRWSRYELDYTVADAPYLVRYDIIGYQPNVDPGNLGTGADYPHCEAGQCPAPQLHLPGSDSPPTAVALAPMIEDMQVAVGCDGWSSAAAAALSQRGPDVGFEELGPAEGPVAGVADVSINENTNESGQRNVDEWVGNAATEQSAPDCVAYGTAEYLRDEWPLVETNDSPPPAFRMSPQSIRVTLTGSSEMPERAGGLASPVLPPIEDRDTLTSNVGVRQRFSLTERHSPDNLRWRDSSMR